MKTQTHVVELSALYKLIPESRSLEHKNFSDLKQLLETLILTLEKADGWEFVQYINNKPSLFIVRKRATIPNNQVISNTAYDMNNDVAATAPPPVYNQVNEYETESYGERVDNYDEDVESVPKTDKLPWED